MKCGIGTRSYADALLVILLLGGIFLMVPTVAVSTTSTYVLGVSDTLDPLVVKLQTLTSSLTVLTSVTDLAFVGRNSILYVDGTWLASVSSLDPTILSLVLGKVLDGIPTVVVRGNPSLLGDSVSGLVRLRPRGVPLIAEGVRIFGTLPDGARQAATYQVIDGFDYAVASEFAWAEQVIPDAAILTGPSSFRSEVTASRHLFTAQENLETGADPPTWTFIGFFTIGTGDLFAPVGRVTSTFFAYRLDNDGSTAHKWFNFFSRQTLEPGIAVYSACCDSTFRNSLELDHVFTESNANLLVDHGPSATTAQGLEEVTYTIGVRQGDANGGMVNANQTQTYSLKHTTVTDLSGGFDIKWVHDIDSRSDSGKLTFTITPGWTVRVDEGQPFDFVATTTVSFERLQGQNVVENESVTITTQAFGQGV